MLCLSLETSTKSCSVALVEDDKTLGEVVLNNDMTHSQTLIPAVDMLLNLAQKKLEDVDLMGVAVGPGSFTGLRIGIATVKGLAFGRRIPVVGVSTLEGLAQNSNCINSYVVPILNARRNQVYTALYQYNTDKYQGLINECVIKLDELVDKLLAFEGNFTFTGDGVPIFKKQLMEYLGKRAQFIPEFNCIPKATSIGFLAIKRFNEKGGDDLFTIKPEYLRLSEAERNLLKGCN